MPIEKNVSKRKCKLQGLSEKNVPTFNELSANVPKSWSKNATLAYWINAYNAYTVKLILDNYPTKYQGH
jgi:hypothetical protein